MGGGDVFPTEMPEDPSQPMVPLDADTAERLLSGRLDPDDAPRATPTSPGCCRRPPDRPRRPS
jgi:hypothetical protein